MYASNSNPPGDRDWVPTSYLPFGVCGLSTLLKRLKDRSSQGEWSRQKLTELAKLILVLSEEYSLTDPEERFCRSFIPVGA